MPAFNGEFMDDDYRDKPEKKKQTQPTRLEGEIYWAGEDMKTAHAEYRQGKASRAVNLPRLRDKFNNTRKELKRLKEIKNDLV